MRATAVSLAARGVSGHFAPPRRSGKRPAMPPRPLAPYRIAYSAAANARPHVIANARPAAGLASVVPHLDGLLAVALHGIAQVQLRVVRVAWRRDVILGYITAVGRQASVPANRAS
eukprot:scaffold1561_cov404-Prasinococcus_capsulatus_cf.AAC.2